MFKNILFGAALLIPISCIYNNMIFREVKSIHPSGWSKERSLDFDFSLKPAQKNYDISLTLKHTKDYEFDNIFLFVETFYQNKMIKKDTMQFKLAEIEGHWKGKGLGATKIIDLSLYNSLPLKKGAYKISVSHGMRKNPLKYITDIFLTVKNHQPFKP